MRVDADGHAAATNGPVTGSTLVRAKLHGGHHLSTRQRAPARERDQDRRADDRGHDADLNL